MNIKLRLSALAAGIFLFGAAANAQDSQPLGDVARQQRQHNEQAASGQGMDAAGPTVITNEEIPERPDVAPTPARKNVKNKSADSSPQLPKGAKQSAEYWKSQALAQKTQIALLQSRITEVSESIRYTSINCSSGCVPANERQRKKQLQLERLQFQLSEQKERLETMQDTARKQGYGSSIYDP